MRRALALLLTVGACEADRWEGWIYPRGLSTPEEQWIRGGPFSSLPACRSWVEGIVLQRFDGVRPPGFDYECGLNCKPSSPTGLLNVCEETRE